MSDKEPPSSTVVIRPRAVLDIEHDAEYLEANAAPETVERFRTALMKALDHLAAMPFSGAPREVLNPRLSGLRLWGVPGFRNYLLFMSPQR